MKKAFLGLFFLALAWVLAGCTDRSLRYISVEGPMLGTRMKIVAQVEGISEGELFARAMDLDRRMKRSMSIFEEGSLLNRVNRNETDSVDEHIIRNFNLADSISRLSGGRYDVTVKPLVEAWGFAGKNRTEDPDVDSLLQFVGHDKVRIEGSRLVKTDPRVQLDFNSVAKGYTVDLLAELVEECGAKNYLVEIGGEIRCRGVNPKGNGWRIGVETPFEGNQTNGEYIQRRLQFTEGGMATSGNYRRCYRDKDGNRVAHTINPLTGRSALSRLLSVTVIAPTCAEADALGTMFLAIGADDALALVESLPDVKVYMIFGGEQEGEYEEYTSPAMRQLLMND